MAIPPWAQPFNWWACHFVMLEGTALLGFGFVVTVAFDLVIGLPAKGIAAVAGQGSQVPWFPATKNNWRIIKWIWTEFECPE